MTTTHTLTDLLALIEPPEYYEAKPHKAGRDLESVRAAILRKLAERTPEPPHFHIWSEIPCQPGECRMPPPTDNEREALASRLALHADGIDRIAHGPTLEGADMRTASAFIRARGSITIEAAQPGSDDEQAKCPGCGLDTGYKKSTILPGNSCWHAECYAARDAEAAPPTH